MKRIVILGAGTAGTMVSWRLARLLPPGWTVTLIDREPLHHFQSGYLYIPFGVYQPTEVLREKRSFLPAQAELLVAEIADVDLARRVVTTASGERRQYEFLVVATGCTIAPAEVPGLLDGWGERTHSFYTLASATALAAQLERFDRGRLVINIAEAPIKCPLAPLEFALLADWYFTRRGRRDRIEIELVTPLSGAFTKPIAAAIFSTMCEERGIFVTPNFAIRAVDLRRGLISELSSARRQVPFDLLVSIPPNVGDPLLLRIGLDDGSGFVPTAHHTLEALGHERVFVVGDAADLPISKAGSVAHFASAVLCENLLCKIEGRELTGHYNGHCDCFIDAGFERSVLVHFNYCTEPLPGRYPSRTFGPFSILKSTHSNFAGKRFLKWFYWNMLLKGAPLPLESAMSRYDHATV